MTAKKSVENSIFTIIIGVGLGIFSFFVNPEIALFVFLGAAWLSGIIIIYGFAERVDEIAENSGRTTELVGEILYNLKNLRQLCA